MVKRNIKMIIEYEGTNYYGWQSQNGNKPTIQETLISAIRKITNERFTLYGASRTDRGVHAVCQTVNFHTKTLLLPERLRAALNANLPGDIVIIKVEDVSKDFNAQFHAKEKTYCYTIINNKVPSALRRNFAYFVNGKRLNLKSMKKASRYLIGKHDFRAFATSASKIENCIRKIYSLSITRSGVVIEIKIRGNGFLYNMVRTIVGTLLLIGKNKIPPEDMKKILKSADRKNAGPNVPPHGLCLMKVKY